MVSGKSERNDSVGLLGRIRISTRFLDAYAYFHGYSTDYHNRTKKKPPDRSVCAMDSLLAQRCDSIGRASSG